MNKSIIRRRILTLRKKNYKKNFKIDTIKFFLFLRKNRFNLKNIGGYYPSNNEIDDLEILYLLEKKKLQNFTSNYRKKKSNGFFSMVKKDTFKD